MNPYQRLLSEARMDPPEHENFRVAHQLIAILRLGAFLYRGPIEGNPAVLVRNQLRAAGASPLITESEFLRAMERRFTN